MRSTLNVKFAVIFMEIVVVASIIFTKYENMAVSSSVGTSWDSMSIFIDAFSGLSIGMLVLQLICSLIGLPFDGRVLPLQLTLQIVGLFSFSCFILMRMNYRSLSYIWGSFCLIPFLLEIWAIISQCLLNSKYQLLDHK